MNDNSERRVWVDFLDVSGGGEEDIHCDGVGDSSQTLIGLTIME